MKKVTIVLKNNTPLHTVVSNELSNQMLDQFYDIVSNEISDNCFEIVSKNELDLTETLLIRASEILYIKAVDHE